MAFASASQIEAGASFEADVCIVGAGPAGLAVAMELAAAGRDVLVFEAGGFLDASAVTGDPSTPRFGGAAWYGRCVPLDPIDFEARPWVATSGWPVDSEEIRSRHTRAARFLGLPRVDSLDPSLWKDDPTYRALNGDGVAVGVHPLTRTNDLGRRHRRAVAASPRLNVVLHATAIALDVDRNARAITGVRARGPGGRAISGRARRYVLAGGGVENARLLLTLLADNPSVLGPSSDAVGRYHMNHARAEGAARLRLDPSHPAYLNLFRRLTQGYTHRIRGLMQLAMNLDAATQRKERLLNACAFFYASSIPRVAALGEHLRRLRASAASRSFGHDELTRAFQVARALPTIARAGLAHIRRRPFALDGLVMVEQHEQRPARESRLTLRGERDRFGRIDFQVPFQIDEATKRTQRRFHQLIAERVRSQGLGRLDSRLDDPEFQPEFQDAFHPMGSTRMSTDPHLGVVDPQARVHGLHNLYVAGSSIFPTGGQANPTLTIVALAIRLADHIRAQGPRGANS